MNPRVDCCIIGGGAAGLAAAASLDAGVRACILEKNEILGRKLLATGGGRCNLTNVRCDGAEASLDFFASLGLATICDSEGRCYPYSGCASDVVKVLTDAALQRGTRVYTGQMVTAITPIPAQAHPLKGSARPKQTDPAAVGADKEGPGAMETEIEGLTVAGRAPGASAPAGFLVKTAKGMTLEADTILLAAGGKASPQFGTCGDGCRLAKSLGHEISRLYPILTGIQCGDLSELAGIRARGRVRLLKDGAPVAEETGEIQFTADGLSGICIFNLTPYIQAGPGEQPRKAMGRYRLSVDLAPDFSAEELAGRASSFGILNERLAARVDLDQIKDWQLPVLGVKGWKQAQCTAGGVVLEEVDPVRQESRIQEGLYLAGELLDRQGPCGGYNLQNAWETGRRAAAAINRRFAGR